MFWSFLVAITPHDRIASICIYLIMLQCTTTGSTYDMKVHVSVCGVIIGTSANKLDSATKNAGVVLDHACKVC